MHIILHRIKTEHTVRDFYLAALCAALVLDFIIAIFSPLDMAPKNP